MIDTVKSTPNKTPHPNSFEGRILSIIEWSDAIVAGGYARWCMSPLYDTPPPSDIDIFCKDVEVFKQIYDAVGNFIGKEHKKDTENTIEFNSPKGLPVQIIKPHAFPFSSPEELLDKFDMTIVQAALITPNSGIVGSQFNEDERNKVVRLWKNAHNLAGFIHRLHKYVKNGYYVSPKLLLDLNDVSHNSMQRSIDKINQNIDFGYFR